MNVSPITDERRLDWLGAALQLVEIEISHGLARGCRCMSCHAHRLTWVDDEGKARLAEGDTLRDAIDRTMREVEATCPSFKP